jgi:hypothetical protein
MHPCCCVFNRQGNQAMANGSNVTLNYNGIIGADSGTVPMLGAVGGNGTVGGNGGNAAINVNGNIFQPMGASLAVLANATGGNGNGAGNGGNASSVINGNIIQTNRLLSSIALAAQAFGGTGAKFGSASATGNGNIIQYSNSTATDVTLVASATINGLDSPANHGNNAFGTKTATVNGNIVGGNINSLSIYADAFWSNGTATINGNILNSKTTNTGTVLLEATGQKIAITGNILNLGKQEVDIMLNELGPTYSATVAGNIFNGTGNNILKLSETFNPGPPTTPDTASINLAAGTFTLNGQSNIINKFGGIALSGNIAGNFIGTSGNNTLDASGDTTTGTIIFQGNGGTDTLIASGTALNVADFAGSDWQYNAPAMHPVIGPVTTVSTIAANILAPNALIPTANDTLMGTFQRLKFLSPANVSDVNDDGFGDLILQDGAGNLQANLMGAAFSVGPAISPVPQPGVGWTAIGTGQFTADSNRNSGVLTQNAIGELGIETSIAGVPAFTGPILGGTAGVIASTFTGWNAITAGDFNGDGASDVLLQQGAGGPVEIAFMNTKASEGIGQIDQISAVTAPTATITTGAWNVVSSGDFNGDGNSDILWQSATNGSLDISLMNGAAGTPASIGGLPSGYTAVGTGDFNGDGKSDVLFENTTTGDAQIWLMNGTTPGSIINVTGPGTTATGWKLLGAEDINKDGFSDLLWQNSVSGDIKAQAMTTGGATLGGLHDLGTVAPLSFKLIASTGGG